MNGVKHKRPTPPAGAPLTPTRRPSPRPAARRPGPESAREARARVRTILVPTDYSEPSRRAFDLACRLAGGGAARLTLVHVPEPPRASSLGMAAGPPLPAGYRGAWESRLSLIRPRDPAVPVEYRIEEGDPAAAILRAAGRTGSDLIVMGTRRKRGLAGILRRGVSGPVSRQASCPVLTLTTPPARASEEGRRPPDAREPTSDSSRRSDMLDYRTILHPTDFSEPALYAFGLARDLARATGGELLVVHVAPARLFRKRGYRREADEALRRLAASDPEVRVRGLLLAGDPDAQIVCTATQLDCGLIVMGTSGRTGLGRLWHGSVARAVEKNARCPVLTVRLPGGEGWDVPDFAARQPASNGHTLGRAGARCRVACGGDV
jgi:nucleotide-binding universal stress UspA family protein